MDAIGLTGQFVWNVEEYENDATKEQGIWDPKANDNSESGSAAVSNDATLVSFESEAKYEVVDSSEAGAGSNDEKYSKDAAFKNHWMNF